jgi:hypothetical protein
VPHRAGIINGAFAAERCVRLRVSIPGERRTNVLNWLKDLVSPVRVADPVLGPLRYLRDTRTWEGWLAFGPTGTQVELLLSGPVTGPSAEQRLFLSQVQARYSELLPSLENELQQAVPAGVAVPGRFVLKAIDLPEELSGVPDWELCYEAEPAGDLSYFAVQLQGWRPVSVSVEC